MPKSEFASSLGINDIGLTGPFVALVRSSFLQKVEVLTRHCTEHQRLIYKSREDLPGMLRGVADIYQKQLDNVTETTRVFMGDLIEKSCGINVDVIFPDRVGAAEGLIVDIHETNDHFEMPGTVMVHNRRGKEMYVDVGIRANGVAMYRRNHVQEMPDFPAYTRWPGRFLMFRPVK